MTDGQYDAKVAELERLLNDPSVPFTPDQVWALLAETAVGATLATDAQPSAATEWANPAVRSPSAEGD